MVVVGALSQRVDQNIKPFVVQHQPGHDILELLGLEDDVELRDRVRPDRLVAEAAVFDSEFAADRLPQPLGNRAGTES